MNPGIGTLDVPSKRLLQQGQSIWLDYIRRSLIAGGELRRLVEEVGVRGVTSNPTIFEKAVSGSSDYDDTLKAALANAPRADAKSVYEALAIEDIQMAADVLRPIYDESDGADGFVSLEVSPGLANDTEGTIAEAKRLWAAVGRPNLMVKVPATEAGARALETLAADGINVNATLMFSPAHYEAVANAYIRGLARAAEPRRVASVASFFISRVDSYVDKELDAVGSEEGRALRGKIAVANAKQVYARFQELFEGPAFADLRARGARPQRPLWASTGTKDPAYSDVLYVEELVGPDTVNTVPPATLDAFSDHGEVRGATVKEDRDSAREQLRALSTLGVDLDRITEQLQVDGLAAFAASFDALLEALEAKRGELADHPVNRQELRLGRYDAAVRARLTRWKEEHFIRRLWAKDTTLWSATPGPELSDRLGWLGLPEDMQDEIDQLRAFADEVRSEGFRHVVLLGMGGSSLAPEVFQLSLGNAPGYPSLTVLDSTHPGAVRSVVDAVELSKTLFLVSSKSGTTTETLSAFYYFWDRLGRLGQVQGRHFVAVTDPGTPLEKLGHDRGFRRVFLATPDVGGRYSALTAFGLVPAALIGADLHKLLHYAWSSAEGCASCVSEDRNPGLVLGATLGELAAAGRDNLTFVTSPSLAAFPAWLEQLIAESTGKDGKGIVPVVGEPLAPPEAYGPDRVFVSFAVEGEDDQVLSDQLDALAAAGHPLVRILLPDAAALGQEIFKCEIAIASASAVLGIHPFNQPDVELAKQLARDAMAGSGGAVGGADAAPVPAAEETRLREQIASLLAGIRPGDYVALQAYLWPQEDVADLLGALRAALRDRTKAATTLGFGPRFLHSTGQLHKGGPNTGVFIQVVDEPEGDLPVPETDYTYGQLLRAQALGDFTALHQRGRRVLRVSLGSDATAGIEKLVAALA